MSSARLSAAGSPLLGSQSGDPEFGSAVDQLGTCLDAAQRTGDRAPLRQAYRLAHQLRSDCQQASWLQLAAASRVLEDALFDLLEGRHPQDAWRQVQAALRSLQSSAKQPLGAAPARAASAAQPTLLAVDGDAAFLAELQRVGRERLLKIIPAATIGDALAIAAQTRLDGAIVAYPTVGPTCERIVEQLRRDARNSGLPLAMIGTEISVEQRLAAVVAGASLVLEKPLRHEELTAAVSFFLAQREQNAGHALILDRNERFVERMRLALAHRGLDLIEVGDGAQLFDTLEHEHAVALILAGDQPYLDGNRLCQAVRATLRWQQLPIFVVGQSEEEHALAAYSAGADCYVTRQTPPRQIAAGLAVRIADRRLDHALRERDPETGLLTRRAFIEAVDARLAENRRHSRPLTIARLDFERKLAPDALRAACHDLGSLLSTAFRLEDLRSRWDDDEFVIAFNGQRPGTVRRIVERAVDLMETNAQFGAALRGGIASFPDDGASLAELIERAATRRQPVRA
ncbi:MAG: diguanylate cyclase [Deltaproteobacteria bacterium]|nr:diguanylate cyclase [Deltaproteobacteria bacterium]